MDASRVKKNTFFMAMNQVGQQLLAFVVIKLVAVKMGDSGLGIYMFAAAMSYFVFLFNDLGVVTYVTREVAKYKDRASSYFVNSFILKLGMLILVLPFLGIYLYVLRSQPEKMWAVALFGIFGFFSSLNQLCGAMYRGHERMEYEMLITLFEKVLITAFAVFFILQGQGVVVLCAVFGGASIISFLVNISVVYQRFLHHWAPVRLDMMKKLLGAAFTFGLFWIITNIHERIDVLMLERLTNDEVMGWYTLAYKLIMVVGLIPMILMTATFPRISKSVHNNPAEVSKIYRLGMKYLFLIALPMVVGTQFMARPICLFFDDAFLPSATVLKMLIFASGIDFFSVYFSGFLMAWNQQRRLMLLQCGALTLNIVANSILIPHFQQIGAAAATMASRGLIFALCAVWVSRRLRDLDFRALPLGIVSTGVMAIFLWAWHGPWLLKILLAAGIYGGVLFLLGGIRPSEILIIRNGEGER